VADLAQRHGTSTNPVREALQQLRGEGFVIITPNRGARVRPIDEAFIRDITEVTVLIEPFLVRWFVGMATEEDIVELERIQALIEENAFKDPVLHSEIDTAFHTLMYERHYNRHVAQLWWRNREVLRAVTRRMDYTLARRSAVIRDHQELLQCIKNQDADRAAETIARHVSGSGRHIVEQMRAHKMHHEAMV
jgi:DNA-binding GntR family transcriptional regulator